MSTGEEGGSVLGRGLPKRYRCLFCKQETTDFTILHHHEERCGARREVEQLWKSEYNRALRAEVEAVRKSNRNLERGVLGANRLKLTAPWDVHGKD